MGSFLRDAVSGVATVALIASATRWLSNFKGADLPQTRDSTSLYRLAWPWRAVGITSVAFSMILLGWESFDARSHPDRAFVVIATLFAALGVWLASGVVMTNSTGITKKVLWYRRTFVWNQITEIRQLKSRGEKAIELRSGPDKLVIDFRYNAFQHLLREIEERTGLQSLPPS
jgi:hypothetical protein